MTLRSKLLLLLVALFAGLGVTQWFLLRALTRELHEEAGAAAFEVGSSVASALGYAVPREPTEESVPFTKILPPEEALILSTRETSEGDIAVDMRLGTGTDVEDGTHASTPWTPLEPALPRTDVIADVVERQIPIPRQGFDDAFDRYASSLALGFLLLSGLGLVAAGWMALRVSAPLRRLSEAAHKLGDGELGLQVDASGSAEFVATARAFNHMSRELQAYERLAREHSEREHLSEIGELARALAHSLRNPLNALGLTLEEHEKSLAANGMNWTEAATARAQIRRIEGSVRSMLSITGGEAATCEQVRLGHLARDVALEVVQDFGGGLEVDVLDPPDAPRLRAVLPELRAVLQTLLVNAAEASDEGGRIDVSITACGEDELTVEVLDRGRGLEPRIESELFEPHATTKTRGTGMGLFLARRIVATRYAGSLELERRDGGGTRARLVLHPRVEESDA